MKETQREDDEQSPPECSPSPISVLNQRIRLLVKQMETVDKGRDDDDEFEELEIQNQDLQKERDELLAVSIADVPYPLFVRSNSTFAQFIDMDDHLSFSREERDIEGEK